MKITHRMKIALATTASCALVFAGALSGGPSAAADTVKAADPFKDCRATAHTTGAMLVCNAAELKRVDAELNKVYQQLVKKLNDNLDSSGMAQLVKTEQRWIAYRDSECEFAASRYLGGSLSPVVEGSCLIDLTVQRTKILRAHVAGPPF
jgi:uncharacterized protein YecT (DUF1311 family)